MKDPNRLDEFYNEFMKIHKDIFPDWRFTQLMADFSQWFYLEYRRDTYYLEDQDFITKFKEYVKYIENV